MGSQLIPEIFKKIKIRYSYICAHKLLYHSWLKKLKRKRPPLPGKG